MQRSGEDQTVHCRPSQKKRVKEYLEQHGSITQSEASTELGVQRLGARIWELERNGMTGKIEHKHIRVANRWGEPCHVVRYGLVGWRGIVKIAW